MPELILTPAPDDNTIVFRASGTIQAPILFADGIFQDPSFYVYAQDQITFLPAAFPESPTPGAPPAGTKFHLFVGLPSGQTTADIVFAPQTGFDLASIEATISAWLVASTGLPAGPTTGGLSGIYNEFAKLPQPAMPYANFKIGAPRPQSTQDEELLGYNSGNPAGQEIETTIVGRREITVSVDIRTKAATGTGSASELMAAIATAAQKPSQRAAFNAAGLAFLGAESPVLLSARSGPVGQGRVVQDFRFSCLSVVADKTGYIGSMGTDGSGKKFPTGTYSGP